MPLRLSGNKDVQVEYTVLSESTISHSGATLTEASLTSMVHGEEVVIFSLILTTP